MPKGSVFQPYTSVGSAKRQEQRGASNSLIVGTTQTVIDCLPNKRAVFERRGGPFLCGLMETSFLDTFDYELRIVFDSSVV